MVATLVTEAIFRDYFYEKKSIISFSCMCGKCFFSGCRVNIEDFVLFGNWLSEPYLQDGELVRTGNAVLKAEITSADGSRAAETEITDNKNGTYEVGYTLRSEGEYSFSLLLYGQPVRGSPFRLRAVKPSDVPQSPDDVKRRVKSPSGTGGHIRQKAVRRPSSMYSTTKKKENPIEDELIYRVGKRDTEKQIMSYTSYIIFVTNQEYLCHHLLASKPQDRLLNWHSPLQAVAISSSCQ